MDLQGTVKLLLAIAGSIVDTEQAFHGDLPGFEGFAAGTGGSNLVQTVVTKDLTKFLSKTPYS